MADPTGGCIVLRMGSAAPRNNVGSAVITTALGRWFHVLMASWVEWVLVRIDGGSRHCVFQFMILSSNIASLGDHWWEWHVDQMVMDFVEKYTLGKKAARVKAVPAKVLILELKMMLFACNHPGRNEPLIFVLAQVSWYWKQCMDSMTSEPYSSCT